MAGENYQVQQVALGQDRQIVPGIDVFRASEFIAGLLSGAANYVSGLLLLSSVVSSVVRTRPVQIHLHNREAGQMTVVLRDGSITGDIVVGPYPVNAISPLDIDAPQLLGRRFLSGVYMVVISGTFVTGIDYQIAFVNEPDPTAVGGYLQ